jgi:hypothetical protein
MNTLTTTFAHWSSKHAKHIAGLHPRAAKLFDSMYRNPQPNRLERLLGHEVQPLLNLDEVVAEHSLSNRYHDGTRAIAVDEIHGTINRVDDFDYNFRPLKESMQNRWSGLASAIMDGVNLPPIEVIQVGDAYFVKDGHHRISVARALKFRYLDAIVEVWAEA